MHRAINYCVNNGKLYQRALVEPLLLCVSPREAQQATVEVIQESVENISETTKLPK